MTPPHVLDAFVSYDGHEVVAYHVLCQSIVELTLHPVRFTPINLANGGGAYYPRYETSDYAGEWRAAYARTIAARGFDAMRA